MPVFHGKKNPLMVFFCFSIHGVRTDIGSCALMELPPVGLNLRLPHGGCYFESETDRGQIIQYILQFYRSFFFRSNECRFKKNIIEIKVDFF